MGFSKINMPANLYEPREFEHLSEEQLELDITEVSNAIVFLEAQVEADPENYTPELLSFAREKTSRLKNKMETMKFALDGKRKQN